MTEFRINRDNNAVLTFEGVVLATTSSRRAGQNRWTELTLYKTDSGKYVIESIGKSDLDGETDRTTAKIADSPAGVRKSLLRFGREGAYLTYQAQDLLTAAVRVDPALQSALEERI